jgi:hypothetical protein
VYRTWLGFYISFGGVKWCVPYCKQFLDKRCGIQVKCCLNDDYVLQEVGVILCFVNRDTNMCVYVKTQLSYLLSINNIYQLHVSALDVGHHQVV